MVRRRRWPLIVCCLTAGITIGPAAEQAYRLAGITPIFDGWEERPDGSRVMYFGYINRQPRDVDLPIGADNGFQPGAVDRGQPTRFLQGRHEHVFSIPVPRDLEGKLVWTIKTPAGTQTAHASFDQLYILAVREHDDPHARPPAIEIGPAEGRVGQPVRLAPRITAASKSGRVETEGGAAEAGGLNVTWSPYRGPGRVSFEADGDRKPDPPAVSARERARVAAPGVHLVACGVTPVGGCGAVRAVFSEPGTYRLRVAARQDGLESLRFVDVTVTP